MEEVEELLELYSVEDLFDVLDIDIRRVLEILVEGGHVVLPDFLERDMELCDD